ASHGADHRVEKPARPHLVPWIVADFLPPADHVLAVVQGRKEAGNLARVVLEVRVEGHDEFAAGGLEPGGQRRRLAEIAPEADAANPRVAAREPLDGLPRAVGAAVIDEDHFD